MKINDQTNKSRQVNKITTDTGRDRHSSFSDFTRRYEVAHKEGHRQK